ncbi:MAG: glycerophosphodiester phosphodiesterase family protein [Candidatus Hydrogenedentales bacterium]
MNVIAHRGASAYAPENTLAAFEKAVAMRAHWFELDCTLSQDGHVIVIHDDDLERTAGLPATVADLTLAQIRHAEAGSWFNESFRGERIPTLGESLDLARGRIGVYVEVKNADDDTELLAQLRKLAAGRDALLPELAQEVMARIAASGTRNLDLARAVIEQIRDHRMVSGVVVQSFSPIVCAVARIEAPEIRTELLASYDAERPQVWADYLQWAQLLNVAGFNAEAEAVDAALVGRMHREGRTVAVWTVNDAEGMRRFQSMGVDAIITDRPDVCLEVTGAAIAGSASDADSL